MHNMYVYTGNLNTSLNTTGMQHVCMYPPPHMLVYIGLNTSLNTTGMQHAHGMNTTMSSTVSELQGILLLTPMYHMYHMTYII